MPKGVLGVTGRCVVARRLPNYAIAAIRTGQSVRMPHGGFEQLWGGEYRFSADDRATGLQGEG